MKKNIVFIFTCIAISFVWIGCKEKKIHLGNEIRFDKEENIRYGNHPEQVLDLYMPAQKNNQQKEVFIMIHGGGWRGGNDRNDDFLIDKIEKFIQLLDKK